jgi:hypothetical protein
MWNWRLLGAWPGPGQSEPGPGKQTSPADDNRAAETLSNLSQINRHRIMVDANAGR